MWSYKVLQLWARVDLLMKVYSSFPKAPALLEPHYQIISCHIQDTLSWVGSNSSAENNFMLLCNFYVFLLIKTILTIICNHNSTHTRARACACVLSLTLSLSHTHTHVLSPPHANTIYIYIYIYIYMLVTIVVGNPFQ